MLKLYKRQINNDGLRICRTIQLESILGNQFFPAGKTPVPKTEKYDFTEIQHPSDDKPVSSGSQCRTRCELWMAASRKHGYKNVRSIGRLVGFSVKNRRKTFSKR